MPPKFIKQEDRPLFPKVFWNRPTMKNRAGRMLIVGGHKGEFALLQALFAQAKAAGIGEAKVAMPESLRRTVGDSGYNYYLPATASGSLAKTALGELLDLANEADVVIVGANLTNNAETSILIESLLEKIDRPVAITEEAISILKLRPELVTSNPNALVVSRMMGIFELAGNHHMPIAIKPRGGLLARLSVIEQLAAISKAQYVVFDSDIVVAAEEQLSLTSLCQPFSNLPAAVVATAATFWIQQPQNRFEALTAAAFILNEASNSAGSTYTGIGKAIKATLDKYEN